MAPLYPVLTGRWGILWAVPVFIQKRDGEFINLNCFTAHDGFRQMGYEVVPFELDGLPQLPLTGEDIVCGNISTVHQALGMLGVPRPPVLNIPVELTGFLGRAMTTTTLGEVRSLTDVPVFIKPRDIGKQFTGYIVREFRDLIETSSFPDETPVIASEVVNFVTEYRTFVLNGRLLSSKHYKGDFRRIPDFAVIEAAVARFVTCPVSYGIDFGLTDDGRTLLVEVNDAYSLGCYGLSPTAYARMIRARWEQMIQQTGATAAAEV